MASRRFPRVSERRGGAKPGKRFSSGVYDLFFSAHFELKNEAAGHWACLDRTTVYAFPKINGSTMSTVSGTWPEDKGMAYDT